MTKKKGFQNLSIQLPPNGVFKLPLLMQITVNRKKLPPNTLLRLYEFIYSLVCLPSPYSVIYPI